VRHQEHKIFYEHQSAVWPSRECGSRILWDQRAVLAQGMVGVPGWVLPGVAIIDIYGLNDRVIARNPRDSDGERRMGHTGFLPRATSSASVPTYASGGRVLRSGGGACR
jgi:hypothetical protein